MSRGRLGIREGLLYRAEDRRRHRRRPSAPVDYLGDPAGSSDDTAAYEAGCQSGRIAGALDTRAKTPDAAVVAFTAPAVILATGSGLAYLQAPGLSRGHDGGRPGDGVRGRGRAGQHGVHSDRDRLDADAVQLLRKHDARHPPPRQRSRRGIPWTVHRRRRAGKRALRRALQKGRELAGELRARYAYHRYRGIQGEAGRAEGLPRLCPQPKVFHSDALAPSCAPAT